MPLYYQTLGSGGVPLILLHGLFGNADNWRSIADRLASQRQVISVDLRNHGRSFQHPQQTYELMAEDLQQLMAELAIEKAHIMGHSIGGKVAMQFAHDYPVRCQRLLVVDIALRRYPDTHSTLFKTLMMVNLNGCSQRKEVDAQLSGVIPDRGVRQFLLTNLKNTATGLEWRINLQQLFCNYPALLQALDLTSVITQPTLFIAGGDSDYISRADRQDIRQQFSDVGFVSVPGAGHWVHADKPDLFCQNVEGFLKDD